jgi:hypothetical protein
MIKAKVQEKQFLGSWMVLINKITTNKSKVTKISRTSRALNFNKIILRKKSKSTKDDKVD